MSSMWRVAISLPLLFGTMSASAQYAGPYPYAPTPQTTYAAPTGGYTVAAPHVGYALADWRRLRQSSGYSFSDYARFLIQNPDWPGQSSMRRWAERAMRPGENAATVLSFFAKDRPTTGNGFARLAEAYAANGRMAEALEAAQRAWGSADLSGTDEQSLWARFGGSFTTADHDRRADALLFAKKTSEAARFAPLTSPARRAAFTARVALQQRAPNAEAYYQPVMGSVATDPGLLMDRARYLREAGYGHAARQLAARPHRFAYPAADPARFYEMLLLLAREAAAERQWETAYNISRHLSDALPAGADVAQQPLGVRDNYTDLAWLAGTIALDRINRPAGAVAMFHAYARAGRSLQVQSKGYYWAGRAALAAGRYADANNYFQRAAAYPELFYGQLALERLGRSVPAPPTAASSFTSPQQRAAFNANRLVQAVRLLGQQGRSQEQALFVRALAESLNNDTDRGLAVELGQQIRRQDLPVWVARAARTKGSAYYVRQAFPSLPRSVSPRIWSLSHGITRQESSFDPHAVSHAGARGLMQLMVPTAREQAGKMGVGFESYRLMSDPSYNVMLGSGYFTRLLNNWDGSVPLAVASYNAGSGNVRKWVRNYGDPRGNVDVLKWIEAIPFSETKGYVQRVIENSVVYDAMNGAQSQQSSMHVSRYLGKSRPG